MNKSPVSTVIIFRRSWQLRLRKKPRSPKKSGAVSVEDLPELVAPEFLLPALKDVVVPAGATAKFMCKVSLNRHTESKCMVLAVNLAVF